MTFTDLTIPKLPDLLEVGMLLYPGFTLLDLVGPQAVLNAYSRTQLVAATLDPMKSDSGIPLTPTATFATCQMRFDVLFVPGGFGTAAAMRDTAAVAWLADTGLTATWITSVCSGSLLLAAAGLLKGYRATSHWAAYDVLASLGVEVVRNERVVTDRNRVTGGGVTAGIDFGLTLLAALRGEDAAKATQLMMEYAPAPPFNAGTPETAGPQITAIVRAMIANTDAEMVATAAALA